MNDGQTRRHGIIQPHPRKTATVRKAREKACAFAIESLEERALLSTYYVSPSGSDSSGGGASSPWKSLQKAADNARAGDVVHVGAGTYNTGMNLFGKAGGTASAPIKFLADPGVTITHAGSVGTNANVAAINIESTGGNYVIQGFNIKSDGSMSKAGIRVANSNNVQVLNNNVGSAVMGIFVSNSTGTVVQGNVAHDSTDQHGIYVSLNTHGTVVRGNTMYNNSWDGLHMNSLNGSPNDGALVEDNVIYANHISGMDIEGVTNATFRNNVIYNNAKHGMTLHNLDQGNTPASAGNLIANNTITGNANFAIQMQAGGNWQNTLFNNVLHSTNSLYGAIGVFTSNPSGLVSDYNVVVDNFSNNPGNTKLTLSQWRSATGQDQHSKVASPSELFVNPGAGDFHLKAGSPAIDAGTSGLAGKSAPTDDRDGQARPQGAGWDVGADESGSGTTPPPADTTAPVISGVAGSNVQRNSATVTWTTNEASDTQVEYGTSTSYGSATALDTAKVTSHRADLAGLAPATLYHYRVKSRDAAGNLAVSGDQTFTTAAAADTTAPVISSVATSGVTQGGATVSWATNEPSDSLVEYGATTAYGSRTVLNPTLVGNHSVSLSGLAANSTYHFHVLSKDAAGNLATSPDFTFKTASTPTPTPGGSWTQTSASDFGGGTASGVVVTNTSGGELKLAAGGEVLGDDFNGSSLGSAWTVNSWAANGGGPAKTTVYDGVLSLAGEQVRSAATFGNATIEGRVAFGAAPYQHFGLATSMVEARGNSWAVFSTGGTTNTLYARVNSNGSTQDVSLGALPSGYHTYRIDPVSGGFRFLVDGVARTTINKTFAAGTMTRATFSAFKGSPVLNVGWLRVLSGAASSSGTFTSSAFDAGKPVTWTAAQWNANLPAGTGIRVETSTGTSSTAWSAWSAVGSDGKINSPAGQFVRYRITLTSTNGAATPTVNDITLKYA